MHQELAEDWLHSEEIKQLEDENADESNDNSEEKIDEKTIAAKCNLQINGNEVKVIIDPVLQQILLQIL